MVSFILIHSNLIMLKKGNTIRISSNGRYTPNLQYTHMLPILSGKQIYSQTNLQIVQNIRNLLPISIDKLPNFLLPFVSPIFLKTDSTPNILLPDHRAHTLINNIPQYL